MMHGHHRIRQEGVRGSAAGWPRSASVLAFWRDDSKQNVLS